LNEKVLERTAQATSQFDAALDDDLNTAEALGAVFEFVRDANSVMDAGTFQRGNVPPVLDFLARFDSVFDVLRTDVTEAALSDEAIQKLVDERTQAKKQRNFGRSDEIRNQLLAEGVIVEDTKDGARWKRK
jgi:cysteinyl-tRNA synthetase